MDEVRIDKWLWAARFFKTRSLAAQACELGRIHSNGQSAKASRPVRARDALRIKNPSGQFEIEVLVVTETRGSAAIAQTLYRETETSRALRIELAEQRKAMPPVEDARSGKPSKFERRKIDRFRGRM